MYEVVKRKVMEQVAGATVPSVKWVVTNKETPKATAQSSTCSSRNSERGLCHTKTKGAPGVYNQKEKDVEITLHVDDFLVLEEEKHLVDLEAARGKVYKVQRECF